MCDVKNMTDEELKNLSNRIAVELSDRKNKERNALLKTLRETVERLYEIDPNYHMSASTITDCCGEELKIDLFGFLLDYFGIE